MPRNVYTIKAEDFNHLLAVSFAKPLTKIDGIFNIVNLLLCIYLFRRLGQTITLHSNLRNMMLSFTVVLTLFNATSFVKNIFAQVVYRPDADLTKVVKFHNIYCWTVRFILDVLQNMIGVTFIGMATERIIATLYMEKYQRYTNHWLALLIIIAQWVVGLSSAAAVVGSDFTRTYALPLKNELNITCSLILTRSHHFITLYFTNFAILILFAFVLIVIRIYNFNQYKRHGEQGLTYRYQLIENINILRVLTPVVLMYALVYGAATSILAYVTLRRIQTFDDVRLKWDLVKASHFLETIFSTLYCLICLTRYFPLFKIFKKDLNWLMCHKETAGTNKKIVGLLGQKLNAGNAEEVYFDHLFKKFNKRASKSNVFSSASTTHCSRI